MRRTLSLAAKLGITTVGAVSLVATVGFHFRPVVFVGDSMTPTYRPYEWAWTEPVNSDLQKGDVVVINMPDGPIIKRVALLPGEVYAQAYRFGGVTGTVGPSIRIRSHRGELTPLKVPQGEIYVLGDNSSISRDSRVFGPVPKSWITRRVVAPKPYEMPEYGSTSRTGDM